MDHFAFLARAFSAFVTIPDVEWDRLRSATRVIEVAKGDTLLAQGEPVDWLGFLARGLLRVVRRSEEREVTLGFETEGAFVGGYGAYMRRTPATSSIEALDPSVVLRFDRALLDRLLAGHACWRELSGRVAEAELARKLEADARARMMSVDERYADLLRSDASLLRRVPQYHLASYLGIAPETLSRIRARTSSPPIRARRAGS